MPDEDEMMSWSTPLDKGKHHHLRPEGLIKPWAEQDKKVRSIHFKYGEKNYAPKSINALDNAHNILVSGRESTFEGDYDTADNSVPALLRTLDRIGRSALDAEERTQPIEFQPGERDKLALCVASLIARSLNTREGISNGIESYFPEVASSQPLVAVNVKPLYKYFYEQVVSKGKFGILYAGSNNFIFGDGFLHTFPTVRMTTLINPICLIPLTPKFSVLWINSSSRIGSHSGVDDGNLIQTSPPVGPFRLMPEAVFIKLTTEEILFCNETSQVYSKEWIHYKGVKPSFHASFLRGQHEQWCHNGVHNAHPTLGKLADFVLSCRQKSGEGTG